MIEIGNFYICTALLTGTVCYFLIKNRKSNPVADRYLLMILIIVSLRFLFYAILPNSQDEIEKNQQIIKLQINLLLSNLLYLHIRRLTGRRLKSYLYLFLMFFYSFVFLPLITVVIITLNKEILIYLAYGILIIPLIVFYIVKSALYAIRYIKKEIKDPIQRIKRKWLMLILNISTILIIRRLLALTIFSEKNAEVNTYWVVILTWMFVCIHILTRPLFLRGYISVKEHVKSLSKSTVNLENFWISDKPSISNKNDLILEPKVSQQIEFYKNQIEYYFQEKFNYKTQDFTIDDLAKSLNIHKSHLKFLFKYHAKSNFSHFLKMMRINLAKNLISNEFVRSNTLDQLSTKVGFKNYNTFFTTFKEITLCTPKEYIEKNTL